MAFDGVSEDYNASDAPSKGGGGIDTDAIWGMLNPGEALGEVIGGIGTHPKITDLLEKRGSQNSSAENNFKGALMQGLGNTASKLGLTVGLGPLGSMNPLTEAFSAVATAGEIQKEQAMLVKDLEENGVDGFIHQPIKDPISGQTINVYIDPSDVLQGGEPKVIWEKDGVYSTGRFNPGNSTEPGIPDYDTDYINREMARLKDESAGAMIERMGEPGFDRAQYWDYIEDQGLNSLSPAERANEIVDTLNTGLEIYREMLNDPDLDLSAEEIADIKSSMQEAKDLAQKALVELRDTAENNARFSDVDETAEINADIARVKQIDINAAPGTQPAIVAQQPSSVHGLGG